MKVSAIGSCALWVRDSNDSADEARVFFGFHFFILWRPDDPAVGPGFAELVDPRGRDPSPSNQQKL